MRNPRSITFRLTALYSVTTMVVLAVCGVALYWFLMRSFEVEDSNFLAAKIHELRADFSEDGNHTPRLVQEIRTETGAARFREYYARLVSRGRILAETPGMSLKLPHGLFPPDQTYREFTIRPRLTNVNRNHAYMLATVTLGRDAVGGYPLTVQLAADVTRDRAVLADYRDTLLVVLVFGTLLAAGLGIWAARRGLTPLRAITQTMEGISLERLGRRDDVKTRRWPRELGGLAEAFDRMLVRLAESFERLRQFSADVAHELRTPLNNLRGEAEVTLSQSRSAETYRRVVESMHEESLRLSRIVESLLFLARAEQGQAPLKREPFELAVCVDAVLEYFRPLADEKGISLARSGSEKIAADADLVQRVIANLVSNAIRYTPTGGSAAVAIEHSADGAATVRVSDTGHGIAAEHLPRLFDRFYRIDAARSEAAQGSGLGLSIVYSIMTLHGGSVEVTSVPGSGTTVTLAFPPT